MPLHGAGKALDLARTIARSLGVSVPAFEQNGRTLGPEALALPADRAARSYPEYQR